MKFYLIYCNNVFNRSMETLLSQTDLLKQVSVETGIPVSLLTAHEFNKTSFDSFLSRHQGKTINYNGNSIQAVEWRNESEIQIKNGIPREVINTKNIVLETLAGGA